MAAPSKNWRGDKETANKPRGGVFQLSDVTARQAAMLSSQLRQCDKMRHNAIIVRPAGCYSYGHRDASGGWKRPERVGDARWGFTRSASAQREGRRCATQRGEDYIPSFFAPAFSCSRRVLSICLITSSSSANPSACQRNISITALAGLMPVHRFSSMQAIMAQ